MHTSIQRTIAVDPAILSPSRGVIMLVLFVLTLAGLAFAPASLAVTPPPDGGYPNNTTAEGDNALFNLTTGTGNTAVGFDALFSVTGGGENTAVGQDALSSNTGSFNTGNGFGALQDNTTGVFNTANGAEALNQNTTASFNTATGADALLLNQTGANNTATGYDALNRNGSGAFNTATGSLALFGNLTGSNNTATGWNSLHQNESGNNNTALGVNALFNLLRGNGNIALGNGAGTRVITQDNNIDVGNAGVLSDSGVIRIGTAGTQTAAFIAGIRETPITGALAIGVTADGQLGVRGSSARFKEAIQPMDHASEAILALRPVSFRYRKQIDPKGEPQFGLVAEEVQKIDPALVECDANGKPFTVRYDAVNAMLLNEFIKEHHKVSELESMLARQEQMISALSAALKKQAAEIQKVNARIPAREPATRLVSTNQ